MHAVCNLQRLLQLKDSEEAVTHGKLEIESMSNRQRALREELADREGALRIVRMNLETQEKQAELHQAEVSFFCH